jgi:hypothetical protein
LHQSAFSKIASQYLIRRDRACEARYSIRHVLARRQAHGEATPHAAFSTRTKSQKAFSSGSNAGQSQQAGSFSPSGASGTFSSWQSGSGTGNQTVQGNFDTSGSTNQSFPGIAGSFPQATSNAGTNSSSSVNSFTYFNQNSGSFTPSSSAGTYVQSQVGYQYASQTASKTGDPLDC